MAWVARALAAAVVLWATAAHADEGARNAFARDIERAFLRAGFSVDVYAQEPRGNNLAIPNLKHPSLVMYGAFSKASVFQITEDTGLLRNAQAIGFKGLDFWDKAGRGHWVFDLSGSVPPKCDVMRRLC